MDTDQFLMQDPDEIRKVVVWGTMFERHGCLICESKLNLHAGYGFCLPCAKDGLAKWEEKQKKKPTPTQTPKPKAKAKKR
jgi:hypothetical protein